MAEGRPSDVNRLVVYAKKDYQDKVDALAKPLKIPIDQENKRHRSPIVRQAIDLLHEKHFPERLAEKGVSDFSRL